MVNQLDRRIIEVSRLGFDRIVVPEGTKRSHSKVEGIEVISRRNLDDAIEAALQ
jgi:predicted ATP-dependent serine protease